MFSTNVPYALGLACFGEIQVAWVDEHGAARLTARSLGEQLGVDPSALYRHFESLSDLANSVIDHVFGLILGIPLR